MYYRSESQAVITRQEFSLKGEMGEIGAGGLRFTVPGLMSVDRGRVDPCGPRGWDEIWNSRSPVPDGRKISNTNVKSTPY